ncbi:MAG: hypothetical protein JJT94_17235 [Bernardetiaceae bacterium]|nr:hypothetical protein [Bernardetiaceae bacterium]
MQFHYNLNLTFNNKIMARLLTGTKLYEHIGKIFYDAEKRLLIVAPSLRLHPFYKRILRSKIVDTDLEIIIVFGKKGRNLSITPQDGEFFKLFPRIEIRYEARLRSTYYANEKEAILTSTALDVVSKAEALEVGVLTGSNILNNVFGDSFDIQTYEFFLQLVQKSEVVYKAVPHFSSGIFSKKKYKGSHIEVDKLNTGGGI